MRRLSITIPTTLIALITISGLICSLQARQGAVQIANLYKEADRESVESIRQTFQKRNPGYDMTYLSGVRRIDPRETARILFVQEIDGITSQDLLAEATLHSETGSDRKSETIVGDLLILGKGERVRFNREVGLLIFTVPESPDNDLPSFIRPDWDPHITDVIGGCATEMDAYRRILLTWSEDQGRYIYHGLNAHRVRIHDSFSHYHPVKGGFDEFYLVQMVKPGAKLFTSEQVELITGPDQPDASRVNGLIDEYSLSVGDLIYLPRGVMHRGYGGVLTQVITVPGFIPGSEIGVDHHLRAINERLGLTDEQALPYNEDHSYEAVIR